MHGTRFLAVLAMGILVACASANSGIAPALPAPRDSGHVALSPPAVDLSGSWATGSGSAPPAGPVVEHPSCAYNPATWIIQQTGNTLKAWSFPESFNQGVARAGPGPEKVAAAPGTISGTDVRIDDGTVRLLLSYDPESGHLLGTRDGAPFWAARQTIVRTEACVGIPTIQKSNSRK
jgi:hypothetical protein